MGRSERIKKAFDYARYNRIVGTQKDVAELMKASRANVSAAINGREKLLTDSFIVRFNKALGNIFNSDWLLYGNGEMLQTPCSSNSGNVITGGTNTNINMTIGDQKPKDETFDEYEKVETAPIIPSVWIGRYDFDIVEAIENRSNELQRSRVSVAGTSIDAWYHMLDDSMHPYFMKGDKIALSISKTSKIIPGRIYGIDTISYGLIVRVLYNDEGGYRVHAYNNEEYPDFCILNDDVLNIFAVVCSFRI